MDKDLGQQTEAGCGCGGSHDLCCNSKCGVSVSAFEIPVAHSHILIIKLNNLNG